MEQGNIFVPGQRENGALQYRSSDKIIVKENSIELLYFTILTEMTGQICCLDTVFPRIVSAVKTS